MNYAESKYLTAAATVLAAGLLATPAQAQETPDPDEQSAPKQPKALNATSPEAGQIGKNVQLNANSEREFRLSIRAMKAALVPDDRKRLTDALMSLALEGENARPQDLAANKTVEQIVYDKMGPDLHGKTFDDVVKMAG